MSPGSRKPRLPFSLIPAAALTVAIRKACASETPANFIRFPTPWSILRADPAQSSAVGQADTVVATEPHFDVPHAEDSWLAACRRNGVRYENGPIRALCPNRHL